MYLLSEAGCSALTVTETGVGLSVVSLPRELF